MRSLVFRLNVLLELSNKHFRRQRIRLGVKLLSGQRNKVNNAKKEVMEFNKIYLVIFVSVFTLLAGCTENGEENSMMNSDSNNEGSRSEQSAQSSSMSKIVGTNQYGRGAKSDGQDANAIVIYFSRSGNTENLVKMIQKQTTTDVLELTISEPYPEDYDETVARARMPWIVILVFLGMISASLISSFEETLSQVVVLAVFIPIIMDSAENVGTQSLAVAVRNIPMGEEKTREEFWQNVLKELLAGMIIGLSTGVVLALVVGIFYQNLVLAVIIGFSLLVTLSLSTVVGAVIPFLINRLKIDPAIASGPFITTINDAMGLLIYFSAATKLIHVL